MSSKPDGKEAFEGMKKAMVEHPEKIITIDSCSQATSSKNWLTYDEISEETKAEISNALKNK
ncbi:hypothetical protein [Yersinia ruckeri]|uniref:hypothetical protein n=1 Tax=Yersinia ruckeri TaxID=29486 RepID=UPI00223910A0|nr:hypothetical protein [Yersinia ruckeri]MCW6598654.1 hypothetical protein [Yersinia ruckeri]